MTTTYCHLSDNEKLRLPELKSKPPWGPQMGLGYYE